MAELSFWPPTKVWMISNGFINSNFLGDSHNFLPWKDRQTRNEITRTRSGKFSRKTYFFAFQGIALPTKHLKIFPVESQLGKPTPWKDMIHRQRYRDATDPATLLFLEVMVSNSLPLGTLNEVSFNRI
jgi:hypothetical protein